MERTLTIDDDVLAAAEDLAAQQHRSVDEVISDIGRRALLRAVQPANVPAGFPSLLVRDMTPVTLKFVNKLQDGID